MRIFKFLLVLFVWPRSPVVLKLCASEGLNLYCWLHIHTQLTNITLIFYVLYSVFNHIKKNKTSMYHV
jgi:hypothetical protein